MLTKLNILAIILGLTIVGLIGYFIIKNINRSPSPPPTPHVPLPQGCSSTDCGKCSSSDYWCNQQDDCIYDKTNEKCKYRTAPPPLPPIPQGCSSTDCGKCSSSDYWCNQQDDCIYDQTNDKCIYKSCNIPQEERINVPGCDNHGEYNCTIPNTCLNFPGKPCFDSIEPDPNGIPWCYISNGKECNTPPTIQTNVELYNGTKTCLSAQAGGSGKCSDLVPKYFPQNITLSPDNVQNFGSPWQTQTANEYVQYWTTIQANTANLPNSTYKTTVPNNNDRAISVTVPTTEAPPGGYPYVLSWQFMGLNGYGTGWHQVVIGGLAESDIWGNELIDDPQSGLASYMLMLKYIVAAGYVVVNISELVYDTEFWMECQKPNKSVDQMCWNDGKNADADALKLLFDKIKNNNLIENIDLILDYDNMAALGYSVGAQMVSRMINNFPYMKTTSGAPMPTIKLGIMIGGGSYWCYNYDNEGNQEGNPPSNFLPCGDENIGCCPNNKTEDNYDKDGPLSDQPHPPVLLLQGEQDMFASWEASSYYFNLLSSRGDPVYRVMGPILNWDGTPKGRHGPYACQIPAIIALLQLYLK